MSEDEERIDCDLIKVVNKMGAYTDIYNRLKTVHLTEEEAVQLFGLMVERIRDE